MGVCDVADVGPVKEIVVVAYLEASLAVGDDGFEPCELLTIVWTKDPGRTERTRTQEALRFELRSVRIEYEALGIRLGLVVRVECLFRDIHAFVDIYKIFASVVDDSCTRRVDEFGDAIGDAACDDVGCAADVDGFVECCCLAVDGGCGVDDDRRVAL